MVIFFSSMSEEKRKNARTQGKFSDPRDSHIGRRVKQVEKKNVHNQISSKNNDENVKSQCSKSKLVEGISLEYQENSNYSFKELTDKKPIEEIRNCGTTVLSTTENGISKIMYHPGFLDINETSELMVILKDSTEWHRKNIIIHGKEYPQPRLVAWYGPFPYTYSGSTLDAAKMPSCILNIKQKIERFLREENIFVDLNSVLLNFYRNGKDSVAWHSDDELTMGVQPTIASVSLGEVRAFQMRPKPDVGIDPETKFQVNLLPGSLLIMDGCMQKDWQHQVPKEYHDKGERINLTFRTVYALGNLPTQVPCSRIESANLIPSSKLSQLNPVYDTDNFPPLQPSNNPKSDVSDENNSITNVQNISNEKDIAVNSAVAENGSAEDSDVNKNSDISNRNPESPVLSDSAENNLPDTEKLSESEVSSSNKLTDNAEDEARRKSEGLENKENHSHEEAVLNTENGNEREAGSSMEIKFTLNVNAPDFIPSSAYMDPVPKVSGLEKYKLHELVDMYSNGTVSQEFQEFVSVLIHKLKSVRRESMHYFVPRDWAELDVYMQLIENGEREANQRVINDRIISIIQSSTVDPPYRSYGPKRIMTRTRGRNMHRGRY